MYYEEYDEENDESYEICEKIEKLNMFLNSFSSEQLDEIIIILKYIAVLNMHPEFVTPEIRTDIHNRILEAVDKIEDERKQ